MFYYVILLANNKFYHHKNCLNFNFIKIIFKWALDPFKIKFKNCETLYVCLKTPLTNSNPFHSIGQLRVSCVFWSTWQFDQFNFERKWFLMLVLSGRNFLLKVSFQFMLPKINKIGLNVIYVTCALSHKFQLKID